MYHDGVDPRKQALVSLILFALVGILILVRLAVHLQAKSRIWFHFAALVATVFAFPWSWELYNCSECTEWKFVTSAYLVSACLQCLAALYALSVWYAILQSSKDDEDLVQQTITRWNAVALTCAALVSTWTIVAIAYVLKLQESKDDREKFWSSTAFRGFRWSSCLTIFFLVLILSKSMIAVYNRSNDPGMQHRRRRKIGLLFAAILVLVAGYSLRLAFTIDNKWYSHSNTTLLVSSTFPTVMVLLSSVFMLRGIGGTNKARSSSEQSDETVVIDRSDSGVFRAIGGRTRRGSYFIDRSSFENPLSEPISSTASSVGGLFALDGGESDTDLEDNSAIVLPSGRVTVLNEHASSQPEAFRAYNYLSSATSSVTSVASMTNSSRRPQFPSFTTGQVEVL